MSVSTSHVWVQMSVQRYVVCTHKPTGVSGDVVLHDDLESVPQFAGDVVEDLEVALEPVRPATVNVQQELNRSGPRAASATTVHLHP